MCCKKIKDILHPLNIFGKDRKNLRFDLYDVDPIDSYRPINIIWTGERLIATYTDVFSRIGEPNEVTPYKFIYTNGNYSAESFQVLSAHYHYNPDHSLYLDCTNVTYLEINGERLI